MSKNTSKKEMPRRKFLQSFGSGIIGTSVIIKNLPAGENKKSSSIMEEQSADQIEISLTVNGKKITAKVFTHTTLAQLLRENLDLSGTKIVCNHGECGACTVLLNNQAVYACHMLAMDATGAEVTTIEGLLDGENLHPLQQAFVDHDGLQCGFCTPGQIMSAQAILLENPNPDHKDIVKGMSGNLCRCAAYPNILKSAIAAAEQNHKS